MYCQNCGKELLDSDDKYCRYCGSELNISKEIKNDSVSSQYNPPSLKWFNFYYAVGLPITIIFNIIMNVIPITSQIVEHNNYNFFSVSTIILFFILYIFIPVSAQLNLKSSKETGYKFLLLFLICDYICKITFSFVTVIIYHSEDIFTYIFLFTLIYSIWFIPNIIYFFKRRKYFCECDKK